MWIAVRMMSAVGCCTGWHGGRAPHLCPDQCRRQRREAEGSSRDEQWALGQQVPRGCRPWAHSQLGHSQGSRWEQVLRGVLGMAAD